MSTSDMFGHLAYLFLVLGMVLLAKKCYQGWVLRFIGEAVWVVIGVHVGMTSIWLWGIVFMGMDVYGFWKWKRSGA